MSTEPDVGREEEGPEAERQAASRQNRLSKEVESGSQRTPSSASVIAPSGPVVQRNTPRPAAKSQISPAPSPPSQPVHAPSKPFSMSYGGMTQAQYIQYLRDRGSS